MPGSAATFTRETPEAAGVARKATGPKATAAALFSSCNGRLAELRPEDGRAGGFVGRDGESLVFCNRERSEVCIQTGADVCTVKADGRVFLNGDPLDRSQPGFLQMQRKLADLGAKVAAGGVARAGGAADLPSRAPWDPASPAHPNYVL